MNNKSIFKNNSGLKNFEEVFNKFKSTQHIELEKGNKIDNVNNSKSGFYKSM